MNPRHIRSLQIHGTVLSLALVVQYALGMYVNLFISFPTHATDTQLWEFAWSQKPLAAHILLAILILLGALVALVRAIWYREGRWIIANSIGLVAIVAAGASGAIFIPSQTDAYSYAMSFTFLIAIFSYVWGLFSSKQPQL